MRGKTENVKQYLPIMNKDIKLLSGREIGNGDEVTTVDAHGAKGTSCLLHADGGEVEVATNLILGLPVVCPVLTGLDGAVCAWHPIHPTVLSMLDTIPIKKDTEKGGYQNCQKLTLFYLVN
jgi:hypothetical protein